MKGTPSEDHTTPPSARTASSSRFVGGPAVRPFRGWLIPRGPIYSVWSGPTVGADGCLCFFIVFSINVNASFDKHAFVRGRGNHVLRVLLRGNPGELCRSKGL